MIKYLYFFLLLSIVFSGAINPVCAEEVPSSLKPSPVETVQKKRNYFWPPVYSLLVPGLDQWIRKEWANGAVYSGIGAGGLALGLSVNPRSNRRLDPGTRNDRERFQLVGFQMYSTSGFLSAHHAFLDAVQTRPDDFSFLSVKDSDWDILKAPLQIQNFIRPTTFIPLILMSAFVAFDAHHDHVNRWMSPSLGDYFFSSTFSYGAGTGEEAFFRGFLMPTTMKWTHSEWGSNAIQATVFAVAHRINPLPWPQFLFGLYTGWLSQRRGWGLSETVFIHTWWDIIAFLADYSFRHPGQGSTLYLTPISLRF